LPFLLPTLYTAGPVGCPSAAGQTQSQCRDYSALATAIIANQEVNIGPKLNKQIGVAHEVRETHGNYFAAAIEGVRYR